MKNCLAILLAGWAIGVAVPGFAQQKDTVDPKVAHEIDAVGKLAEAINKNDADAVAAIFTEDGVCVTPQGPIYGREAIKEHYTEVFKQFELSNDIPKADPNSPILSVRLVMKYGKLENGVLTTETSTVVVLDKTGDTIPQFIFVKAMPGRFACRSSTSPHRLLKYSDIRSPSGHCAFFRREDENRAISAPRFATAWPTPPRPKVRFCCLFATNDRARS